MKIPIILLTVAGMTVATTPAFSQKDDDHAAVEVRQLLEKARAAKADGRFDEAEELASRAKALRGEVKRDGEAKGERKHTGVADEQIGRIKGQIQQLRAAGKDQEAERLERELSERVHAAHGDMKRRETPERVQHAREAVKHLHAAGLYDEARHAEAAAQRLGQEARGEAERDRGEGERGERRSDGERVAGAERERQAELGELRAQMRKISAELDNLRQELQRQRERRE
jgi:hypothetical protein